MRKNILLLALSTVFITSACSKKKDSPVNVEGEYTNPVLKTVINDNGNVHEKTQNQGDRVLLQLRNGKALSYEVSKDGKYYHLTEDTYQVSGSRFTIASGSNDPCEANSSGDENLPLNVSRGNGKLVMSLSLSEGNASVSATISMDEVSAEEFNQRVKDIVETKKRACLDEDGNFEKDI